MNKVTYIILSYNQETFIADAIDSIIKQDYTNIELIVSDDQSSDNSWNIIQRLSEKYNSLSIQTPKNKGVVGNINHAIPHATGDYIILMGGDDISIYNRSSKIVDSFIKNPHVYCIYTNTIDINKAGNQINSRINSGEKYFKKNKKLTASSIIHKDLGVLGCSAAYRKDVFSQFSTLPSILPSEDKILSLRASLLGKILYLNESLIKYRIGVGISNNTNTKSMFHYKKLLNGKIKTLTGFLQDSIMLKKLSHNDILAIKNNLNFNQKCIQSLETKKWVTVLMHRKIFYREKIKYLFYKFLIKD